MALWTTANLTVTVESLVSLFLVAQRPLSLALCGNNNIPRGFQPRERGSMDGPHGNPHPRQKKSQGEEEGLTVYTSDHPSLLLRL